MSTILSRLTAPEGSQKTAKRVGRGVGSGLGKTCGKGMKGQKARTGHHGARVGFEGGQMPMQRRLPKRGFHNPFREEAYPVNLSTLEKFFPQGGSVDLDALRGVGIIPKSAKIVKILGTGDLKAKLAVKAHRFSKSAVEKLEAVGGSAEVLARPAQNVENARGKSKSAQQ